jgi:phenylacetate-CoA ligase
MYGRKDGTISYMGANIYPQDVEQGIYTSKYADKIENFILSLDESKQLDSISTINIELKEGIKLQETAKYSSDIAHSVATYMAQVNRDFVESLREDQSAGNIKLNFFEYNTDMFANKNPKQIKNKYILPKKS